MATPHSVAEHCPVAPSKTLPPASAKQSTVWRRAAHIVELDGVRGLAILFVTLYRFSQEIPTDTWFGNLLRSLFAMGDRGVELFFVLSGFLITGILLDSKLRLKQQRAERSWVSFFGNFFARRSLRIFPLYFGAIFFLLVVLALIDSSTRLFAQARENQLFLWTYLVNVKMSTEGAWCFGRLDHFWSLAVEEHFYLLWPVVVFFASPRTTMKLALGLAMVSAFSRILFASLSNNGVAPDVLTLFRCDGLLLGAAIAIQIRTWHGLGGLFKWTLLVAPACLLVAIPCELLGKRLLTIPHTLWPIIWACLLIWVLTASPSSSLSSFLRSASLRKLGKYSYAMYVFQNPLIVLASGFVTVPLIAAILGHQLVAAILYTGIMFGLTYAAALLSWNLFERPLLRLKDRIGDAGHRDVTQVTQPVAYAGSGGQLR